MKKILITEHRDEGFIVLNDQLTRISTNNEEVLSGGPPTPGNKYMDLSLTGTGTGTELDPYTRDQFCTVINGSIDTFYVKGTGTIGHHDISNITGGNPNPLLRKWESDPWRLYADVDDPLQWTIDYVDMSGGILSSKHTLNLTGQFKNCDLRADNLYAGYHTDHTGLSTVKGCNLIASGQIGGDYLELTITDSIVIAGSSLFTSQGPITRCVTNLPTWSFVTAINSQVNWTPPEDWPAWNAAKSLWDSATLSVGINTPPQPGTPPYTDYTEGLFGGVRTGIGALDFPAVVAPVANFTATPTSGTFPLTVNFTDTSTGTPTSWAWDFGDGSPIVTDQSPQYIYDIDAGIFTVTLTVTNAGGSDEEIKTGYITVNAIAPTITTQPVSQTVALSSNVTFSVVAVATPPLTDLTYQWQKGDVNIAGATSSSLTLSHVLFTDQNNYRVVVTDAGGFVNSNEATLTVIDTKKAGASNNPDDRVGMPKANDEVSGTQVKDTNLGTGYGGNTLELGKINHIGLILRDTQDGSSDGPRARNNENTNGVKGLLPRMAELVQTITTFFYKVR